MSEFAEMEKISKGGVRLAKTGVLLGVGASLSEGNAALGVQNLSTGLPTIGAVYGTGASLRTLKKIPSTGSKKKLGVF